MKNLLSKKEKNPIDRLIDLHGGKNLISREIQKSKTYESRLEKLQQKGKAHVIDEITGILPNLQDQKNWNSVDFTPNRNYGTATIQVSGFQGTKAIVSFLRYASHSDKCFIPAEMISVVGLTDEYVYNGDLLSALIIAENLLGVKRFCTSCLVSTPLPEKRFTNIEEGTGVSLPRIRIDDVYSSATLVNQGTAFGNLCGIECANDNHLMYLDSIIRAAKETGASFFLNPGWNTIIVGCYAAQYIPEITFKVSCFLGSQSVIHFRLLLNIIQKFLRPDGTSPIVEINIGNGVTKETYEQCSQLLKEEGLESISLATHIRINSDLGAPNYNWFNNASLILENGYDVTLKYESAGSGSDIDTLAAYFVDDKTRLTNSESLGEILFNRCLIATRDAQILRDKGIQALFAEKRL